MNPSVYELLANELYPVLRTFFVFTAENISSDILI